MDLVQDFIGVKNEVERARTKEHIPGAGDAMATFLTLSGLRGFWPMSSFDENGDAYDLSGQGRILTYNGNPTYNRDDLVPYIDLGGTGDYFSRADEAGLKILGTESYVANPGLTFGGWFNPTALQNNEAYAGKFGAVGQRSFFLSSGAAPNYYPLFLIFDAVSALSYVQSTVSISVSTWYFMVCRFKPSIALDIFVSNSTASPALLVQTTNAVAIPASLFDSNGAYEIGHRTDAAVFFNGWASTNFLYASWLTDSTIKTIYNMTKSKYRVF